VKIVAEDTFGNTVTSFNGGQDKVKVSSNRMCTLGCVLSPAFTNGVLVQLMTLTQAGPHATISAKAKVGSTRGTSNEFTVDPGAAARLAFTSSTGSLKLSHSRLLSVVIHDAYGNKVSDGSHDVTFAQSGGLGSLSGLGDSLSASGVATILAQGALVGPVKVTASSPGLNSAATQFKIHY
jgi:hypothetical protein